jgi:hypothetical protein
MHHGSEARIRDIPLATAFGRKVDGLLRAEIDADTAPLTPDGIDHKPVGYGPEPAEFPAGAASGAKVGIDHGYTAAHKIRLLSDFRLHQQMEVGRVDIGVAEYAIFCKSGKSCGQAGFAGSALAADDDYFPH